MKKQNIKGIPINSRLFAEGVRKYLRLSWNYREFNKELILEEVAFTAYIEGTHAFGLWLFQTIFLHFIPQGAFRYSQCFCRSGLIPVLITKSIH